MCLPFLQMYSRNHKFVCALLKKMEMILHKTLQLFIQNANMMTLTKSSLCFCALKLKITKEHKNKQLNYFWRLPPRFFGPQVTRGVTAAHSAFLFCVVAVELKNTTIWKGGFYFSSENGKVRVNAENSERGAGEATPRSKATKQRMTFKTTCFDVV